MPPCVEHPDHLFGDLALLQEHPEDLMLENGLQLFEFQRWRDPEHPLDAVKTSICQKDVAVRIEPEEVAKGLHSDDSAGDRFLFRHGLLHKDFQRFPGAAAETRKQFSIIKKIPA